MTINILRDKDKRFVSRAKDARQTSFIRDMAMGIYPELLDKVLCRRIAIEIPTMNRENIQPTNSLYNCIRDYVATQRAASIIRK